MLAQSKRAKKREKAAARRRKREEDVNAGLTLPGSQQILPGLQPEKPCVSQSVDSCACTVPTPRSVYKQLFEIRNICVVQILLT